MSTMHVILQPIVTNLYKCHGMNERAREKRKEERREVEEGRDGRKKGEKKKKRQNRGRQMTVEKRKIYLITQYMIGLINQLCW